MITDTDIRPPETNSQIKDLLLRNARLGLYRENSFHQLALPVRAAPNEISKRQQVVEICLKTESSVPPGKGISFFQDLIPDTYKLEEVTHRLRNPESRLIDEFFWFWPVAPASEADDQGLNHLRKGTLDAAVEFWKTKSPVDAGYGVALHNLAIYTHIWVLEQEASGFQTSGSPSFEQDLDDEWDKCYEYWQALIDCEGFWSQLSNRIREIDDPRMTTGSARRIRSLLPSFLCTTQLKIALAYAENNQLDQAERLVEHAQESQFLGEIFDEVSRSLLESHQKRLRQVCKSAETQIESSPRNADQSAENLITIGKTSLEVLDLFAPRGIDAEMHDLVVDTALSAVRSYGVTTEKYKRCLKLLADLKTLAVGDAHRNEVEETIKATQELISKADLWCGEAYFDLPEEIFDVLERARTLADQMKYQEAMNLIHELQRDQKAQIPLPNTNLIHFPLAYCLNRQSVRYMKEIYELVDRPREVFVKIGKRVQQAEQSSAIKQQLNYALWGYENRRLDQVRQNGLLYCMACGKQIRLTNFSAFMNNDLPVVICWTCNHTDDQELSQRKQRCNSLLLESHKLLSSARQLNPNNNQVKENLTQLRETANQLKMTLPADPVIAAPKPSPTTRKPTGTPTQPKAVTPRTQGAPKKSKPITKAGPNKTTLNYIVGISVLFIVILAILFALFAFATLVAIGSANSNLANLISFVTSYDHSLFTAFFS